MMCNGVTTPERKVFVEALDRAFENVCELDLVFHFDEVGFYRKDSVR